MKFKIFLSCLFITQASIAEISNTKEVVIIQPLNAPIGFIDTQITNNTQITTELTVPQYLTISNKPKITSDPLADNAETKIKVEILIPDDLSVNTETKVLAPDHLNIQKATKTLTPENLSDNTKLDITTKILAPDHLNIQKATKTLTPENLSDNTKLDITTKVLAPDHLNIQKATKTLTPENLSDNTKLDITTKVLAPDHLNINTRTEITTAIITVDTLTKTKEINAPLQLRGTGDLGLIIERDPAAVQIINTTDKSTLHHIDNLGDLSHASVVYSRDTRYAYIFGRDGGLTKIDLLKQKIDKRIIQAGNSIGGAISQDGTLIAVSNYQPAGVNIFSSKTLELIATIPALYDDNKHSKVVGLVDAPGQKFVFSLFDAGEIWIADMKNPQQPTIKKFKNVGKQPYDALLSPDGRYYIAGLFGTPGLALLDLWSPEKGVQCILPEYGKHSEKLPVYKMPHLEGWAMAGNLMFIPAVGQHEVLVIDTITWTLVKSIPVFGQPVFVMARPDARNIWVNFAFPNNSQLQVIDVKNLEIIQSFKAGNAILHMEFSPRGEQVWVSARDDNQVIIYDTQTFKEIKRLPAKKPSGIFFTNRAHKMGL